MLGLVFRVALVLASPSPDGRDQAQVAFADGADDFGAGRFDEALEHFTEAQRLAPHDKVRFNIGQCLVKLGRFREAFPELEAAASSSQLSADERGKAKVAAAEAASKLGTLEFHGDDGRTVTVDDSLTCTIPCSLELDPGPHSVESIPDQPPNVHTVRSGEVTKIGITATLDPVPPPRLDPPPPTESDRPPKKPAPDRPRPTALTWVGLGLAIAGGAGIIGFGLHANTLHDRYLANPTPSTRRRGLAFRNTANASIGIAILGAALITADLIRLGIARRR